MATNRNHRNAKIKDEQGNWYKDQEGILQIITKEFRKRVKSDVSSNLELPVSSRDIKEVDNELLTMEVSDVEILEAVKHINALKTPGLKGMQAISYKKRWNIIGISVAMVRFSLIMDIY